MRVAPFRPDMDPVTQLLGTLTSLGFSEIEDTNGKQI